MKALLLSDKRFINATFMEFVPKLLNTYYKQGIIAMLSILQRLETNGTFFKNN